MWKKCKVFYRFSRRRLRSMWQRFRESDRAIHALVLGRFPKTMSAIDRTLESLFQSFGNGAFGVFIGLLLVVLVATGVIPTIVAASLFGAWLIALVWLARLRPLKGLTVVSRWLIVLIGGMVFAFAANYFGRWALLQVRNQKEG